MNRRLGFIRKIGRTFDPILWGRLALHIIKDSFFAQGKGPALMLPRHVDEPFHLYIIFLLWASPSEPSFLLRNSQDGLEEKEGSQRPASFLFLSG